MKYNMVFTSAMFMFMFLPLVTILYFLINIKFRNILLLIASLLFYAWGEPKHVIVMLISIAINYYFGLLVHKNSSDVSNKKKSLIYAIVLNLGMLMFFKYFNFIIANINSLASIIGINKEFVVSPIHLPIGISFFTFQGLSYVIDVYRNDAKVQKNIYNLALYISFFPQLIAGPIVRYHDVAMQIDKRDITIDKFCYGIRRFILGFGKKILISNQVGFVADKVFAININELSTSLAWIGIICYTLQIYFDFSGYSGMAIGLGKMFGFDFLENFNFPYISKSISEFWKRWHMSLTNWFRDYVYIPLGGNRKGKKRTYINQMIVFLLSGLWHGASWNFIFWGAYYGAFLVIERTKLGNKIIDKMWTPLRHVYALLVVIIGWVFFRCETLTNAWIYIKKMFIFEASSNLYYPQLFINNKTIFILICAIILSTPILSYISKKISKKVKKNLVYDTCINAIYFCILLVSIINLAASTYNPFIYFRF